MKKIICRVRYLLVKLYATLFFRGKVKIGVTGSMRGITYFSVNSDGVIDIEPHCRIEKSQMAVVRRGKILVLELLLKELYHQTQLLQAIVSLSLNGYTNK